LFCFHQITDQDIKEIISHIENGKRIHRSHSESSDAARRAILKLYTYESPLYKTLNTASCHRDARVVPTLGPFAWLLSWTLCEPPQENVKKQQEKKQEKERHRVEEHNRKVDEDNKKIREEAKEFNKKASHPVNIIPLLPRIEEIDIEYTTLYRGLGLP